MMLFALMGVLALLGCAGYVAAVVAGQANIGLAFVAAFLALAGQIVTIFVAGFCVASQRD